MDADEIKSLGAKHGVFTETIQKDYVATILLFVISEFSKISEMVFKGGTALKKIYFPETRFSEDLDFTCNSDISNELESLLKKKINHLDVNFTKVKKMETGKYSRKYSVKYLNYNDYPSSIKIDLSLREKVIRNVETLPIQHFYSLENGNFSIPSMSIEEIMAEKIRALAYAQKPRHLYDLWYLFEQGIKLDKSLVNTKLSFYKEFSLDKIKEGINKMKTEWDVDLNPLLPTVPSFDKVSKNVIQNIEASMK
ncbi:MAG: nucleotidyl transferase AbiEii/AbiGii toxin family protein [Thaumarchaeota archaeon]|nr:nucleotidyl transferase AbiEii/AbiGii toxin family protein [Nitrososphaerota archaeon]